MRAYLYQLYRIAFDLRHLTPQGDKNKIRQLMEEYDDTLALYTALKKNSPSCATLYDPARPSPGTGRRSLAAMIEEYRAVSTAAS